MKTNFKTFVLLAIFSVTSLDFFAAAPTNINDYTTDGIIKQDNGGNLNIKCTYIASKENTLVGITNICIVMSSPSGTQRIVTLCSQNRNHYYNESSHWSYGKWKKSNGYVFFDLQAVEPGIWTLRKVQTKAGTWYYYNKNIHTITATSNNEDLGTASGGGAYLENASATLKATAKTGCHFVQWDDGNTDATHTVTVTEDATYTAIFALDEVSTEEIKSRGLFSVSETKKVMFAPGNLQYRAALTHQCADGTEQQGVWRFAEHQYDFVGGGNQNTSSTYYGWIDLFAWGTSGWSGSGATCYQPYSVSTTVNDYLHAPLKGDKRFADFGIYNAISNGGNTPEQWRLPTLEEWDYLFYQRPNASALLAAGKVDTINGLILLPDEWEMPSTLSFTPSIKSYSNNVYSKTEWQEMEWEGAVFLPAAGYTVGSTIRINTGCWYASSDTLFIDQYRPGMVRFTADADSLNLYAKHGFSTRYAVRLVQEVTEEEYEGLFTRTEIASKGEMKVYVKEMTIVVENALDGVEVYDIMGRKINQRSSDGQRTKVTVPAKGIYIVKTGETVVKAAVR